MFCTKGSKSTDIFPQEKLDPFDCENNGDIVRRETRTRAFKNQMPRIPRLEDNTLDCGRNTFILGSASTSNLGERKSGAFGPSKCKAISTEIIELNIICVRLKSEI